MLIVLYRWGRAYSRVFGEDDNQDYLRRLFANGSVYKPVVELAQQATGSTDEKSQRTVRRALRDLVEEKIVAKVEISGRPTVYAPHAIGGYIRLPQAIIRVMEVKETLDGGTKSLEGASLLAFVALCGQTYGERGHRAKGPMMLEEDRLRGYLPLSEKQLRKAFSQLVDEGLVIRFKSRGQYFIVAVDS